MTPKLFKDKLNIVEPTIFEVEGLEKGYYDAQAVQYDKLISNFLYNKIMWGNTPEDYLNFCRKALQNITEGSIADIGCGTLGFTHQAYSEHHAKELYLCDLSYEMLKIGKQRLKNILPNSNIHFVRANALQMPFQDNSLDAVLNFGLFHIFPNPAELIQEILRILKPNGQLFLTSLCTNRKLSAKYLNLLYKKGHVTQVLSAQQIKKIVEENGMQISELTVKGGMTYLSGKK